MNSSVVTAEIPYTIDTGEILVNETFGPNDISRRRTGTRDVRRLACLPCYRITAVAD